MPSSAPVADKDRLVIGLATGSVVAYNLDKMYFAWTISSRGEVTSRPILTPKVVVVASHDGSVIVSQNLPTRPKTLYRFATSGPISANLGKHSTGEPFQPTPFNQMSPYTLVIPSEDNNLYGIDLFTGDSRWVVPTGAPIKQEPLVAGDIIYVINEEGTLTAVDLNALWLVTNGGNDQVGIFPETKKADALALAAKRDSETGDTHLVTTRTKWALRTGGGRPPALGKSGISFVPRAGAPFVVDKETGAMRYDAATVLGRFGLDLREFSFRVTNGITDRLYFATPTGLLICLHEIGLTRPLTLKDPREATFGFVPEPDSRTTPAAAPGAETTNEPAAEPKKDNPDN